MRNIDAHHHLWKFDSSQYAWISQKMAVIRHDFLPADLKREIDAAGIEGVVSVQARQSLQETIWLLSLAGQHDFIRGVVGWAPLAARSAKSDLETLAREKKLKAVRHVLQGEPDDNYMLRDEFNAGVALLRDYGLAYDILIFEKHLPQTIKFVDRHPNQVFVLDHVAKPRIKDGVISPWRENIKELSRRQNVYIKLSGMVTEADWAAWTGQQLKPYVDTVLEAFTPRRIMFGSDWPVCLLACTYGRWVETVSQFIGTLSPASTA
jgi:L-fuconolactonase